MKSRKALLGALMTGLILTACGGGGESAGTSNNPSSSAAANSSAASSQIAASSSSSSEAASASSQSSTASPSTTQTPSSVATPTQAVTVTPTTVVTPTKTATATPTTAATPTKTATATPTTVVTPTPTKTSTPTPTSNPVVTATPANTGTGGYGAPVAGGLPVYDGSGNVVGSTLTGARVKHAQTFAQMNEIVAAARINDAGKTVKTGAYPLLIVYHGNEDSLINQVIADHTVIPGGDGSCPNPRWNDDYREVSLKEYTAGLTIIGANGSSANFGITIVNGGNVIIRNMKIGALAGANNDADMIRIDNSPNVWIDHNEFFAVNNECKGSPDSDLTFESAIDIKKNSDNVTVSYNYIHDSKKVGLDGHTASSGVADFQRHITYHHNYYKNVNGRLPLQRGGWVHAYNNFYDQITGSGINVRSGGIALVENNWFQNSKNPLTCRFDTVNCGTWEVRGNNTTNEASNTTYNIAWDSAGSGGVNANAWTSTGTFPTAKLSYSYTASSAQCVKDNLLSVVGVGKNFATLNCAAAGRRR